MKVKQFSLLILFFLLTTMCLGGCSIDAPAGNIWAAPDNCDCGISDEGTYCKDNCVYYCDWYNWDDCVASRMFCCDNYNAECVEITSVEATCRLTEELCPGNVDSICSDGWLISCQLEGQFFDVNCAMHRSHCVENAYEDGSAACIDSDGGIIEI